MRIPLLSIGSAAALILPSLMLAGCGTCERHEAAPPQSDTGSQPHARVPAGAESRHAAAQRFFNAYKTHNRAAATAVAADEAIDALRWNASSGTNPTLQLADDTHIYYEGGSVELKLAQNAAGQWYVRAVVLRAD